MTHDEIGQPRVGSRVAQRGAVDAAGEEPGSQRHSHRGTRVPLVLAPGVDVDFRFAPHDGRDLGPSRPHRHRLGTQAVGNEGGELGGPGAAHHDAGGSGERWQRRRVAGIEHQVESGQGHRTNHRGTVDGQGHMDGPVGPPLGVLAGPVQRIDDPDPAGVGGEGLGLVVLL